MYIYTWFLELYIHYTNQYEEGTRKANLYWDYILCGIFQSWKSYGLPWIVDECIFLVMIKGVDHH